MFCKLQHMNSRCQLLFWNILRMTSVCLLNAAKSAEKIPSRHTTLNQHWFNVDTTSWFWIKVDSMLSQIVCLFVDLHSFVIMIFAFANNVQIVLYLYSRRLERKKYLGSDLSLCQRVQPDKIPWDGWKIGASVPRCKITTPSAPWIPPVQIWMMSIQKGVY